MIVLRREYRSTWRTRSGWFWLAMLWEEVIEAVPQGVQELSLTMLRLHQGPARWKKTQVASISIHWLEYDAQKEEQG